MFGLVNVNTEKLLWEKDSKQNNSYNHIQEMVLNQSIFLSKDSFGT